MAEKFSAFDWHRAVFSVACTLDPSESLVLLALVMHAGSSGACWPALNTLCQETRLGRTKVVASIAELERRQLVLRSRPESQTEAADVDATYFRSAPDRRPNVYRLGLLPDAEKLNAENQVARRTGSPREPVRDTYPTRPPGEPVPGRQADPRGSPRDHKLLMELPNRTTQGTSARSAARPLQLDIVSSAELESSDFVRIRDRYFDLYTSKRGMKPPFGGAEGKAIKALLAKCTAEQALAAVEGAFAGYRSDSVTIRQISSDPASFIGMKARRGEQTQRKQPEDKSPGAWRPTVVRGGEQ